MQRLDLLSFGVGVSAMTITMAILWTKYGRPRDASDASIDERCVTEADSSCTCLIKIGGSACTIKDSFETFNFKGVSETSEQIADAIASVEGFRPVIVHGAGSFGHFQAKQYSVAQGVESSSGKSYDKARISPFLREGFAKTRLSVSTLNHHILTTMLAKGVAAVGVSPFPTILAIKRQLARGETWEPSLNTCVSRTLDLGLVPVLHGDACLEISGRETSIISGDTLMVFLCEIHRPKYAVFLADVEGVLTAPPGSVPEPELIDKIFVDDLGNWTCDRPDGPHMTQSSNDVTGGIKLKLKSAVEIVSKFRIPVYIVKAGSPDAASAIKGIPPVRGTSVVLKQ